MKTIARRLIAAGVCLSLLVLSSCSGDGSSAEPNDPPSTSADPTPTSPETESPPTIPPDARGDDETSAKAFVRYYFRVLSDAMNDGDVWPIYTLSAVDCVSCTAVRRNIAKSFADGGTADSQGWKPTRLRRTPDPGMSFELVGLMGEETFYDADRQVVRHFDGSKAHMRIRLVRNRSSWLVKRLEISR